MANFPSDGVKPLTSRIAALLSSDEGARAIALLQQIELGRAAQARTATVSSPRLDPSVIGIWERQGPGPGSPYVRSKAFMAEWPYWADLERIEPKGERKRIVLLGESVARGFFYEPHFAPATLLQVMLDSIVGFGAEVVDLARSDLNAEGLENIVRRVHGLGPDCIVVFAGNNWCSPTTPAPEDIEALRDGRGLGAFRVAADAALAQRAESVVTTLAAVAKATNVPIVVAIPEFNLMDWQWAQTDLPCLGGQAISEWISAQREAAAALVEGHLERALANAARMVELDEGNSATSYQLMARAQYQLGRKDDARRSFRAALAAGVVDPFGRGPRILPLIQESLRKGSEREGISIVDLPRTFQDHLAGDLPDRRLFHDYSHLTVRGMELAMGAIARAVASRLRAPEPDEGAMAAAAVAIRPSEGIEAQAHFYAAIHNAHWGQAPGICEYHCRAAVDASPAIAELMLAYVSCQWRESPPHLYESFRRLVGSGPSAFKYFTLSTRVSKLMDASLFSAMYEAMASVPGAVAHPRQLDELLSREHGLVERRSYDLLAPQAYATSYYDRNQLMREAGWRAHFVAHEADSPFVFVCERPCAVTLTLVYRLPRVTSGGHDPMTVQINGTVVHRVTGSEAWEKVVVAVPASCVRAGLNEVLLTWPTARLCGDVQVTHAADRRELGRAEIYARFAEIHELRASCDA